MKRAGLLLLPAFFTFLIMLNLMNVGAYTNNGTAFLCYNCSDCNNAMGDGKYNEIYLVQDMVNYSGTCIGNPKSANNIKFNCLGHLIDGDDSGNGQHQTYGVYFDSKSNNKIINCTISDFYYGIYLVSSDNMSIENNYLYSNTYGIALNNTNNTKIINNGFNKSTDQQIAIYAYSSLNNSIKSNIISSSANGIYLLGSRNFSIINNTLKKTSYGIQLSGSSNSNLIMNNIINSTLSDSEGLLIQTSNNNTIYNNKIINNKYGMHYYNSFYNNVSFNNVSFNNYFGIYLYQSSLNYLFNNSVIFNGQHGLYVAGVNNSIYQNYFCFNNQSNGNYFDIYSSSITLGDNNSCDTVYNYNDSSSFGCKFLCDTEKPKVNLKISDSSITKGDSVTITCSASDEHGISNVIVKASGKTICSSSSNSCSINYKPEEIGTITITCTAYDTYSNSKMVEDTLKVSQRRHRGGGITTICGNNKCDYNEDYLNCPSDCKVPTEKPENITHNIGDVTEGKIVNVSNGDIILFMVNGEEHTAQVGISNEGINLWIWSKPIFSFLKLNETEQFDLNNDGEKDLEISYMEKFSNKALLLFKGIKKVEEKNISLVNESHPIIKEKNKIDIKLILLSVFILLILIFLVIFLNKRRNPKTEKYIYYKLKS